MGASRSQVDEARDEDPDSRGLRVQLVLGTSRRLRAGSSGARNDLMSRSLRRRSGDMPRKGEPPKGLSAGEIPGRGESSATRGWWRTVERDMARGTRTRAELKSPRSLCFQPFFGVLSKGLLPSDALGSRSNSAEKHSRSTATGSVGGLRGQGRQQLEATVGCNSLGGHGAGPRG